MDDDRPIQPDDHRTAPDAGRTPPADRASNARADELAAFLDCVRPQAGRLPRLATIAAGDPAAGELAVTAAVLAAFAQVRDPPPAV